MSRSGWLPAWVFAVAAVALLGSGLAGLLGSRAGVTTATVRLGNIPLRVFAPTEPHAQGPVVVIAHGFAGSQQLMQPFALALARNGYTAITFDFAGHGRNAAPLTGSITEETGATRTLVEETKRVAAFAKGRGDGRLALLGHSMASDIIVRAAAELPDVAATITVSMFSPVVTATTPRNLLVIVGDWEGFLKTEALRAVGLATAPRPAVAGATYGSFTDGTARRAAFAPATEHVSVLFSRTSQDEAVRWLDATFGTARPAAPVTVGQGLSIVLLLTGAVLAMRPLSALLPIATPLPAGAGLGWSRLAPVIIAPMIATPLVLRVVPTHFLPVLVGDYLAAHFLLYGLLTAAVAAWTTRRDPPGKLVAAWGRILLAAAIVVALYGIGLAWPIDTFVTSFWPGPNRLPLVLALLVGTLSFFLANEWVTRGLGTGRGAYTLSKVAFLVSLAIAVTLDFERLFFLMLILPVIVPFFLVFGLMSGWIWRRTGHPFVAAIANAVAFAWAIGVTFPLLAA